MKKLLLSALLALLPFCAVNAQWAQSGVPGCGIGVPSTVLGSFGVPNGCAPGVPSANSAAAGALVIFDFRSSVSGLLTFSRGGTVAEQDFNSTPLLTSFGTASPAQPVYNYQSVQPEGLGIWSSSISRGQYSRNLTQAIWTKTNATADLTQTGIDGTANSATLLTATASNATVLQSVTTGTFTYVLSAFVKRVTGTGTVYMTTDGGATLTDITSCLSTTAWTRVPCNTDPVNGGLVQNLANPNYGFKIVTSGDAIAVDYVEDETQGASTNFVWPSPPILSTATGNQTRSADSLTVPLSSITGMNINSFTIVAQFILPYWETLTSTCYANATNCPLSAAIWEVNDGTNQNVIIGVNQPGQYPSSCLTGSSPCDDDFNVQTFLVGSATASKARASTVTGPNQGEGLIHPIAGAFSTVAICYDVTNGMAISATNSVSGATPEVTTTNPGFASNLFTTLQVGSSKRTNSLNGYMRWMMVFNGCSPGSGNLTNLVSVLQNY